MASYTLVERDVTYIRKAASDYLEAPTGYRSWCPIETVPHSYVSKWYELNRFVQPAISREGHLTVGVATSRTEGEANLAFMRYKFEYPITEVMSARRTGVPLQADNVRLGLKQMNLKIAQMIITGSHYPIDIDGLTETGTDLGGTLDTTMWGTAGEAITHAGTAYDHMMSFGLPPPYNWVVSYSLAGDLAVKHNAASDLSTREYIEKAFGFTVYFENSAATGTYDETEDAVTIYPMEHTADDGVWLLLKADSENFALQEVSPPAVYMDAELNRESNTYVGYIDWHGTLRVTHGESCGFMEDVNLA